MKNKLLYIVGSSVVAGSLVISGTAFAATKHVAHGAARAEHSRKPLHAAAPALFGEVTAVNGSSLTVEGGIARGAATTTYTIDASNAKITKGFGRGAQTIGVSSIAVGDRVAVIGTISGTNIAATAISDAPARSLHAEAASASRPYVGTVIATTASGFTIESHGRSKNASSQSYAVAVAGSTQFVKNAASAALSDVSVGEMVRVTGTFDASTKTLTADKVQILVKALPSSVYGKKHPR